MAKVPIKGLHIKQAKGRWYVTVRATGESLLKGFTGSRDELLKKLGEPEFLLKYSTRKSVRVSYPEGSVGHIIEWFKRETDRWANLSQRTKSDYEKAYAWLGDDMNYPASEIAQSDMVRIRNKASKDAHPKFSNHLLSALSSAFDEAVEEGLMAINPCIGVKRKYKPRKDANREWTKEEQDFVFKDAPAHLLAPMLIAREAGLRGEDIFSLKWKTNYENGRFTLKAKKNGVALSIPVYGRLRDLLDTVERTSIFICVSSHGKPYKSEKMLQQAVGNLLRRYRKEGKTGPDLTLHGLRVTLAAELKRMGEDDKSIADALGDMSEAMGAHYSRHVLTESRASAVFERRNLVVQNG